MPEVKKVTLRIPPDLHEWYRKQAFVLRESMHSLMLKALRAMKEAANDEHR